MSEAVKAKHMEQNTIVANLILFLDPSQLKGNIFSDIIANTDVLSTIFQMLAVEPSMDADTRRDARQVLLRVALLCKAFTEPALDALWKELPSLLPLFRLLPAFGLLGNIHVVEDIHEDDWLVFDDYARRVRVLCLDSNTSSISPSVYTVVSRARSDPVLSGLKELRILNNHPGNLSDAFLAIGPNVEVLEIAEPVAASAEFLTPFLLTTLQHCPAVRRLYLQSAQPIDLRFMSTFTTLDHLDLKLTNTHLTPQLFASMGHLEHLSQLTIHVGAPLPTPIFRPLRSEASISTPALGQPFRSLRSLSVIGSISLVVRLLGFFELKNLTSFRLQEESSTSGNAETFWIQCFQKLSSATRLEEFEILQFSQPNQYDGICLEAKWMDSLSSLNQLRSFIVRNASFSSSDSEIAALTSPFSLLKTFILPEICHGVKLMTIHSIIDIANSCPLLDELKVPIGGNFDTSRPRIKEAFQTHLVKSLKHPLRLLSISSGFGRLPDEDTVLLAQVIFRTFSYLSSLEGTGQNQANESWPQIYNIYKAIQTEVKTLAA